MQKKLIRSLILVLILFTFLLVIGLYFSALYFGPGLLTQKGFSLKELATMSEIVRSFIESFAIIIGGFWAYNRFKRTREAHTYPKIQHRIEHYDLKNETIYLSVFVTVTNEGRKILDLRAGKIIIRQVLPIPKRINDLMKKSDSEGKTEEIRKGDIPGLFIDSKQRLGWDTLGERDWKALSGKKAELEPGQTREFQFDFLMEDNIEVIEAISYFEYEESDWVLATLYSLEPQQYKAAFPSKYG